MLKRLLPFLPLIFLIACVPTGEITNSDQTAVVQTLTAKAWTPTPILPTATTEPNTGKIVEILNNAMTGVDPLADTIEARFSVVDAQIIYEPPTNLAGVLIIRIECEWVFTDNCAPETSFVALMHALTTNEKVFAKITDQIPSTIHTLQVVTLNHMTQKGMIIVPWADIVDYATGKINGSQLGSRITRVIVP